MKKIVFFSIILIMLVFIHVSVFADYEIVVNKYLTSGTDIVQIPTSEKVEEFLKNVYSKDGEKCYIYKDNVLIQDSDIIGTGMVLKVGNSNIGYNLSVLGDLNGDGRNTALDISIIAQAIVGMVNLQGIYYKTADVNDSSTLTALDLSQFQMITVGLFVPAKVNIGKIRMSSKTESSRKAVQITVEWPENIGGLIKQISVDSGKTYINNVDSAVAIENGTAIARLVDSSGKIIRSVEMKIDTIDPNYVVTPTGKIKIFSESDISKKFVKITVEWPENIEGLTKQISVDSGKTYINNVDSAVAVENGTAIARLIDNTRKVIMSVDLEITDIKIDNSSNEEIIGDIVINLYTWSSKDGAQVKVTWPRNIEGLTKQISVNNGKTYRDNVDSVITTENGIAIARLIDSTGKIIKSATLEITTIERNNNDNTVIGEIVIRSHTAEDKKSVQITVDWPDNLYGLTKQISVDGGKTFISDIDSAVATENGIAIARLIDNTGKVYASVDLEIKTIIDGIQYNIDGKIVIHVRTDKSKKFAEVTVDWPNNIDGLTKQISVDNGKTYIDNIDSMIATENNTAIARLVDPDGNVLLDVSIDITKIGTDNFDNKIVIYSTTDVSREFVRIRVDWPENINGLKRQISVDSGKTFISNVDSAVVTENGIAIARLIDNAGNEISSVNLEIRTIK